MKDGGEGDYEAGIRFDPARFDGGTKTFLGRTGPWNASDIARIALEQPAAAEHLARKLYRFFVRDDGEPGPELIGPLADRIRADGFSIRKVLDVIFRSRHFYSAGVRRHLIKSPVEFTAGLVRMLEVPRGRVDLVTLAILCDRLADLLLQDDLAPEARSLAIRAGRGGGGDGVRKGLQILLSCPEFQLA